MSVSRKLEIVDEAESSGNVASTAQNRNVQPKQIRHWRKYKQKLIDKKRKNSKARTVNRGNSAHHPQLETQLYDWVIKQRKNGFAVSPSNMNCKALQIDAHFKDNDKKGYVGGYPSFNDADNWCFDGQIV